MNRNEGGPFGAVVVKNNVIIGRGNNKVLLLNDPTAHAEIVAIRDACSNIKDFQLIDCVVYTSCEPCPMCMGSIYWARPKKVYYGCSRIDAAKIGFDDELIYQQLEVKNELRRIPFIIQDRDIAIKAFELWFSKQDKTKY
jgi:tRNA(Arg) A34 adenosine deaminase TadA